MPKEDGSPSAILINSDDEIVGEWRSLVAHLFWVQGVASSNLVSPTISLKHSLQLIAADFPHFQF